MIKKYQGELGYLVMVTDILKKGGIYPDRTGVGRKKIFNCQTVWQNGEHPFSTNRLLGIRPAWEEMKLFLSGNPDTKVLEEKGIMFWKGHTSREFLDSRGMQNYPVGSLGKSYSKQFRSAGDSNVDQLQHLVHGLMRDPYGSRHTIDLWGVSEQAEMPLLPCWFRSAWFVERDGVTGNNILHVKLYNRSLDALYGYWMAVQQYSLLQRLVANLVGMEMGSLTTDHVDVHLYLNQLEYAEEMLYRDLGTAGVVSLKKDVSCIDELVNYEYTDFLVEGYEPNKEPFYTKRPEIAL